MADPLKESVDDNVIKDIKSFTADLQKSLQSDLTSDMMKVADLSSKLKDNLIEARSSANIDITGIDEVEKMTQNLNASEFSLKQSSKYAKDFRTDMAGASDRSAALVTGIQHARKVKQDILDNETQIKYLQEETIPAAVQQVEQEKAKLDLMDQASPLYEQQEEKLKNAERSLRQRNSALAKTLGMQDAAVKFQNEFLKNQQQAFRDTQTLAEYQDEVRIAVSSTVVESNKLLSVNEKLMTQLESYGDNMNAFMKKYGGVSDEVMGKFDQISKSIEGSLDKIPLIGGMLSKFVSGPLGEASEHAKKAFGEALLSGAAAAKETGKASAGLAEGVKNFASGLSGIGSKLAAAFSPPFLLITAIATLLFLAVKRALDLESAARDFRKEMGLSHTATKGIEKSAREISKEYARHGVTLEGAFNASKALTEQFGSTMMVSKETTATVSMMAASMGVAEASAAGAIDKFMQIGAGSEKAAVNLTLATSELAAAAGISLDAVMQDVANAGESALLAFSGNPKALAAAAVEARRLGTTVDAITQSMDQMLDFESSMNAEMKLSSMLGRHISMDKARQLAAQGDAIGLAEEQHRLLQQMGGLENMNRFQQKAAAEALGMSVEEMFKMNAQREMELTLGAGELKAHQEKLRKLKGEADLENMTAAQKMRHRMEEEIKEAKMEAAKNRLNELMIELGEKLLPMVQTAMQAIIPIAQALAYAAELIFMPFTFLSNLLSGDISKNFDGVHATFKTLIGLAMGYYIFVRKGFGGNIIGKAFGLAGKALGGLWKHTTGFFGMLGKGAVGAGKMLWRTFTLQKGNIFEKALDGLKAIWGKTKGLKTKLMGIFSPKTVQPGQDKTKELADKGKKKAEEKTKGWVGKLKDKIFGKKDVAKDVQSGPLKKDGTPDMRYKANQDAAQKNADKVQKADSKSKGPGMMEKFNKINMKKVLQGAAALLVISAALWVAAKAFQEFADVEWDAVGKGVVGLGAMVGALVIMAKVLKNNQADLIKGAAALVIIGGAMLVSAFAFQQFGAVPWTAVVSGSIALATMVGGLYALSTFVEGKEKTLLKGIGLLALMGVALIPASFAFQQFAKVPWQAVIAGSVALGVMSTSLVYMSKAMDGVKWSSVFKGAAGIALLGVAMIPASYAFGLFGNVPWAGVFLGITALSALALAAGIIGQFIGQIVQGALAIALLGLAMIPAAFAFGMFSDIDWAGVFIGIGALSLLAIVAGILGAPPIIGFVLLGALAIAALGVALIPFAVAAIMAGFAMGLVADAFVTMAGALSELSWEHIGMIFGLGAAFAFMGALLPFIFLGAIALGVVSVAMIAFGYAADLIAPGIALLADGFDRMVESLSKITFEMVGVIAALGLAFAGMGLLIVPITLGAIAMGIMSGALFVFGKAAELVAPGIALLADGFDKVVESLSKITFEMVGVVAALGLAFAGMGVLFVPILLGSIAVGVMSTALFVFGKAAELAAPGIEAISSAFSTLIDSLSKVTLEMVGTLALLAGTFIMMGVFALPITLGAFAMGVMATSLLFMGFAAEYASGPLMMLGFAIEMMGESLSKITMESVLALGALGLTIAGFALLILPMTVGAFVASIMAGALFTIGAAAAFAADPIASVTETLGPLIDKMVQVAEVAGSLWAAAGAIAAVGVALAAFGAASAVGSVVSSIGGAVSGAIDTVAGWFGGGDKKKEKKKKDPLEQMIRLGEHGEDLAKAADAITAVNDIKFDGSGLKSMAAGMSAMAWAMMDMTSGGVWSWFGPDEKSPLETMADGMGTIADAAKQMEPGVTGLVNVFSGLQAMASETFADGMDAATDAIYRFVAALSTIPDDKIEVVGQFASAGTEQTVEAQGSGPAGMPVEEMGGTKVLGETTELAATIGGPPTGPAAGGGADIDVSGLAKDSQLAQLITLMKSGGIAVYLDSKKVSKQLAAASED